jgi:hypothetical protein
MSPMGGMITSPTHRGDDLSKGRADNDAHGHINGIPLDCEFLELLELPMSSLLLVCEMEKT